MRHDNDLRLSKEGQLLLESQALQLNNPANKQVSHL